MIHYFYETNFKIYNRKKLKKWLKNIIQKENAYISNLNFIFCNDQYLLKINKSYLNKDFDTDVITFDYVKKKQISGDIFISIERVKYNALKWKQYFDIELYRVMAHAILHLLGYKDNLYKERLILHAKEDFYLNLLNL
ncbi:rRNA maturation RNase YbeY [Candidatus Walczuchella endosymbiont of Icerya purchasi]|uniref:rRNA maturation RNase YbeY n=1 Tax=Candidatus Walczuchella endosymbiont of Icerya purchasi TaxID=3066219 RepID=UPI00313C4615